MCDALSRYTTLGVGGKPKKLVIATTSDALIDIPDALVLGRGSNVLVSDDGYDGTVIINRYETVSEKGGIVTAGSGTRLSVLCGFMCEHGLGGMEWAAGIPGTLGGAAVMNAGAFGGEMKDVLLYADVYRNGKIIRMDAAELGLGYRTSEIKSDDTVLDIAIETQRRDKRLIKDTTSKYAAIRRATQPRGRSAGSVFKNPKGVSVAKILDGLGFKGYKVGGAAVSNEHANIIVNTGGATARDVYRLISILKTALAESGVDAEEEIVYIGEF